MNEKESPLQASLGSAQRRPLQIPGYVSRGGGRMSTPIASGWTRGDAPKDGQLYVAMGRVVGSDEWGGRSTPFLSQVRWHCDADRGGWVDERGMAIASDIEARVYIDHWCALPCGTAHDVMREQIEGGRV